MADASTFHDKAKALRPTQASKPTTFWVGVLNDDKKPEDAESENDFLWLKCHKGVTVQTIRQQYMARNFQAEPILLKYGARLLADPVTTKDLDEYGDHLIAMEAIKATDLHARMPRQPLAPSNIQVPAKPASPAAEPVKPSLEANSRYAPPYAPRAATRLESNSPGCISAERHQSQPRSLGGYRPIGAPSSTTIPSPERQKDLVVHGAGPHKGIGHGLDHPPHVIQGWDDKLATTVAQARTILAKDPIHTLEKVPAPAKPSLAAMAYHDNREREELKRKFPALSYEVIDNMLLNRWRSDPTQQRYGAAVNAPTGISGSQLGTAGHRSETNGQTNGQIKVDTTIGEAKVSDVAQPKHFQLQSLLAGAGPELLETAVEKGVEVLENLKMPLLEEAPYPPDAAQWLQQIENVQKQAVKTKTIVGVVGNTGAGKSSVINAMLDEERLVPTNCMRACTAVVTEISYNYTEDPYFAEIEFITPQDWEKELKTLFQDLLDGNGNVSRDCVKEDTEAGVAYAKIKAVYPKKTKEDIANSSINDLVNHRDVVDLLGSSKSIKESDSMQFYKRLQHYVDSKEKSTGDDDKDRKKKRQMEYWPLIKVVRLYVKAPALSTGAVIVDLPGVHDSNAARAAVAEGYMKQCTGLWIVAPINRAVDDKAAKSLLGESFKRQLKMDGGFSSVTFICSKTDDISIVEAQDSLGLDEEMGALWEKRNSYERDLKRMKRELGQLKTSREDFAKAMEEAEEQLEIWETLKDDVGNGRTVFPPRPKLPTTKKRKRDSAKASRPSKKQRRSSGSESDDDYQGSDYADDDSDASSQHEQVDVTEEERGDPLTEEQIDSKIAELKSTKKDGRRQRLQLEEKIKDMRAKMDEVVKADEEIEVDMSAKCIGGRNLYSKGAIQQDFAAGIRELDQELAAEEDEEHFDPSVEIRDYDEVARSLPVFCVSSRGYQKLQGRLRQDPAVPGFKSIEETEIPQLQNHCRQLTEKGRTESCRRFLNNLSQLLNSMSLWASSDGTGRNLTEDQKAKETKILRDSFKKLESGLEKVVETISKDLKEELADNIYDKYATATMNATNEAYNTASHWGAPVNRDDRAAGGYHWSTYKAICRRNGVYSNAQGPHDWNVALADPMMRVLAPGWERTFSRRAPAVIASFARDAVSLIKDFHREIEVRARQNGANIAGLHMLQQQLRVYEEIFKDLGNTVRESINTQQKDISREFIPVIATAMEPAYTACVNENGPGSYMRMKHAMTTIVDEKRLTMFQQSTEEVRKRLTRMITALEEMMHNKVDEVHLMMRRDYTAVLAGPELPKGGMMPRWQQDMRRNVMRIIKGAQREFKRVAGVAEEEEDDTIFDNEEERVEEQQEGEGGGSNGIRLVRGIGRKGCKLEDPDEPWVADDDYDGPLFNVATTGFDDDHDIADQHFKRPESQDLKTPYPTPQHQQQNPTPVPTATNLQPTPNYSHLPFTNLNAPQNPFCSRSTAPLRTDPLFTTGTPGTAMAPTTAARSLKNRPRTLYPGSWRDREEDDEDDDEEGYISVDSCGCPKSSDGNRMYDVADTEDEDEDEDDEEGIDPHAFSEVDESEEREEERDEEEDVDEWGLGLDSEDQDGEEGAGEGKEWGKGQDFVVGTVKEKEVEAESRGESGGVKIENGDVDGNETGIPEVRQDSEGQAGEEKMEVEIEPKEEHDLDHNHDREEKMDMDAF